VTSSDTSIGIPTRVPFRTNELSCGYWDVRELILK
jgi:hypothetical protein